MKTLLFAPRFAAVLSTLAFLLSTQLASAQSSDTVRVFFKFGKSQLLADSKQDLITIPTDYHLNGVDSIVIIGYTDSVGRIESNLKLSLKRAKNVEKFIDPLIPNEVPKFLYARGEIVDLEEQAFGRRVEVVMYYKPIEKEEVIIFSEEDPKCFQVALDLLTYCNVTEFKKGKRDFVRLESEIDPIVSEHEYYYARKFRDGTTEARKIRWDLKNTGQLWWERNRYVTEMPKESYENAQIFYLDTGDCGGCTYKAALQDTLYTSITHFAPDKFLMANSQIKRKWFKRSVYQIRVPIEFIDLKKPYYYNYNFGAFQNVNSMGGRSLIWTNKRGKRRRAYYYSEVVTQKGAHPILLSSYRTYKCYAPYTGGTNRGRWHVCGFHDWDGDGLFKGMKPQMGFQIGSFFQNDTLQGYVGTRFTLGNRMIRLSTDLGLNNNLGFFGNASADYRFWHFGYRASGQGRGWTDAMGGTGRIDAFQAMYWGMSAKTSFNKRDLSFIETNVHLGWCWEHQLTLIVNRAFVEAGIARDWTGMTNTKIYPFVHAGVRYEFSLRKKPKYSSGIHRQT